MTLLKCFAKELVKFDDVAEFNEYVATIPEDTKIEFYHTNPDGTVFALLTISDLYFYNR